MMIMRYTFTLAFILLAGIVHADTDIPDPEQWYKQNYAPLWAEDPAARLDQYAGYYDEKIFSHASSGENGMVSSLEWLEEGINGWLADAWVGSDLAVMAADRLNETTTVFKTRWVDRYSDRADESSCGWYLADYKDGRWVFTSYVEIDCEAHGL